MVIISILVAVTATVVGNAIGNARVAGTKGTLTKIHGLVQDRVRAIDQAVQPGGSLDGRVQHLAGALGVGTGLARTIVMKEELKRVFYGTRTETISGRQVQVIDYPPQTPPNGGDPRAETAKRLYAAVTAGVVHGVSPEEGDAFSTSEVKIDEGDTNRRPYFVDGWGEPLRFYLFPTRLVRPGGAGTGVNKRVVDLLIAGTSTEMLDGDPQDPHGDFAQVLTRQPPVPNPPIGQFTERFFHTPATYHVPLIVSAGADRDLGLHEPTELDVNNGIFGHLAQPLPSVNLTNPEESGLNDNVTSHQRAGGN